MADAIVDRTLALDMVDSRSWGPGHEALLKEASSRAHSEPVHSEANSGSEDQETKEAYCNAEDAAALTTRCEGQQADSQQDEVSEKAPLRGAALTPRRGSASGRGPAAAHGPEVSASVPSLGSVPMPWSLLASGGADVEAAAGHFEGEPPVAVGPAKLGPKVRTRLQITATPFLSATRLQSTATPFLSMLPCSDASSTGLLTALRRSFTETAEPMQAEQDLWVWSAEDYEPGHQKSDAYWSCDTQVPATMWPHTTQDGGDGYEDTRTTVMLRFPKSYTRDMLTELVDQLGFYAKYDFVHLPVDRSTWSGLGYAFINMVDNSSARDIIQVFPGSFSWTRNSAKDCQAIWGEGMQGFDVYVQRYRNSPLMHPCVPDFVKPAVYKNGVRIAFPPATNIIRPPRVWQ
eukprot:TRINITY_DN9157_c0_g1_i1.p1 TRINITY_DN9157_c0_g1~~TRINITY_DN9157_c0_g1_i1.p1  ORF type:complete len:403 (-),score=47.36 TRINITY_DN9157_c0_g1_i1:389-1597(-)